MGAGAPWPAYRSARFRLTVSSTTPQRQIQVLNTHVFVCDTCRMLDDVVEDMAALLGRPCLLEDTHFIPIAHSGQGDVDAVRQRSILDRGSSDEIRAWFLARGIATATGPLRIPPEPRLDITGRICVPARHLGRTRGYFWLLDPDEAIDESLWPAADRLAQTAGQALSHHERRTERLTTVYRDLLEGDHDTVRASVHELSAAAGHASGESGATCVLIETGAGVGLPPVPRRGTVWVRESEELIAAIHFGAITPGSADDVLEALGHRNRGVPPLRVAVGSLVPGIADLRHSRWNALTALRVVRKHGGAIAHWNELGPLQLLANATDAELRGTVLAGPVGDFVRDARPDLIETARTYLDLAGSAARTASALTIHRQTLYHRLAQIQQRTGLDLTSGRDRLALHLALLLGEFLTGPSESGR